jgi:hypothetical protein
LKQNLGCLMYKVMISGGASVKVKLGHPGLHRCALVRCPSEEVPSPVPGRDRASLALKPIEERQSRSPGMCPGSPDSGSATGYDLILDIDWLSSFGQIDS